MRSFLIQELAARLRYHDMPGAPPTRVYLHGLGAASSFDFPEIAVHPALAGHRSLLIDLLGFGFSDRPLTFGYSLGEHAEIVARLLDTLRLTGCHVIGASMGGSIAIMLASERPDLVSRLVVAEANLDPGGGRGSRLIAAQSEQEYVQTGHAASLERLRGSDDMHDHEYAAELHLAAPIAVHRGAVGLVQMPIRPMIGERFVRLSIPRAYLVGERSMPHPNVERLRAAGIPVFIVPAAGHAMMAHNPGGFAEALAKSLAQ